MTKDIFIVAFINLTLLSVGCLDKTRKSSNNSMSTKKESLIGLYSYCLKGEYPHQCEMPMHSLRLKQNNTFILKLFCLGDSLSLLKPSIETGTWILQNDSTLNFTSSDKKAYAVAILLNGSLQIISINEKLYDPSFDRDTANEKIF